MADDILNPWAGRTGFGHGWAVFDGVCGDAQPHQHLAAQMIIGLGRPVRVTGEGCVATGDAVLVRAGARHAIQPSPDPVRVIYLEAFSPLGLAWGRFGPGQDLVAPPADLVAALRSSANIADTLVQLEAACARPQRDPRLDATLARLAEASARPGDIREAARAVGLSEPRLRALVAEQLGAPLSQWRLWFRLEAALAALQRGEPLAAAAEAAGFSDQAHLSRTMRRFLGVTPRTISALVRSSEATLRTQ